VGLKPVEPAPVTVAPQPKIPGEDLAGLQEREEAVLEVVEQPEEPAFTAVPEMPMVEQAAAIPEPEPEELAVVAQKPAESAEPAVSIRSYEPEPTVSGNEMLNVDLPEKLSIIALLDLVGKYLQLDYMYDPTKVKGDVTLKLQGPIKVKDLYPLLESVMKFRNLVMTRRGNLIIIVPRTEAVGIDPTLVGDEKGKIKAGDVIITRIFKMKHIDTASAKNLLTGMKLGVDISAVAEARTLIVTGYAYRMPRVEELLAMVDKPGAPKKFRSRQLRYTMAKTLASKVKTLAEQLGTVSITVAAPARSPAAPKGAARPTARPSPAKPSAAPKKAKAGVYLDTDERTNRILMIGFEEQMAVVDMLIDTLDVEQRDLRTLRLYDIQYVGAEEVKNKLQELGIIGGRQTTTRTTRPTPAKSAKSAAAPAVAGAAAEPLVEQPQVVIIEATNSLLVNGTDEQHIQIAVIIGYVDNQTLEQAIPYEIYPLENQKPEDLAKVLNQLVQETIKDKTGKIEKVVQRGEDIVIVPDSSTFSLIVYASKKNQEWIKKLIKNLDKRRPQVLIDVSLVEITREDIFEYDLNIIANATGLVTGNLITGGEGGLPFDAVGTVLEGGWNLGGSGRTSGFYAEDKIQVLFDAMAKKDYGRILAQPKILVNDNEKGLIKTTEKTYVEEETLTFPGTTQGQVPIPVKSIKFVPYDAKIELSITPNISEGDLLRLEIDMTREDFERKEGVPPDKLTSNVNTIVTVPDGSTIILGGLTKLKQKKAGTKVPLLGDVPLVGGLFRTIGNSDEASKLYVFVKANILRPDETVGLAQLQKVSEESRMAFQEEEDRFQLKEDWPGITPEPMEPVNILGSQ
jgi:general secretion pathway protein D